MRRVMGWAGAIVGILAVILAGGRSVAQDDGPMMWMVVAEHEYVDAAHAIYLQNPLNGETIPLSQDQLLAYLRSGQLRTGLEDSPYVWHMDSEYHLLPPSIVLVEAVAGQYYDMVFWRGNAHPSPDWQWVAYHDITTVGAVNLDEGQPRDLFSPLGLKPYGDDLFAIFSPDGATFFTTAQNQNGEVGLYRLRLDGNNPPDLPPIRVGHYRPIQWLVGIDRLLVEDVERNLSLVAADGTHEIQVWGLPPAPSVYPVQTFFEAWVAETETLVVTKFDETEGLRDHLFWMRRSVETVFDPIWGLVGWQVLEPTQDGQWLIIASHYETLGRVRSDGSQFEVLAEIPDGFIGLAVSPDGSKIGFSNPTGVFQLDTASGQITQLETTTQLEFNVLKHSWSPDGRWFVYSASGSDPTEERLFIQNPNGAVREFDLPGRRFIGWVALEETP